MKRVLEVQAKTTAVTVTVRGVIEDNPGHLTSGEVAAIRDQLADSIMLALNRATYVHAPLCEIKVK